MRNPVPLDPRVRGDDGNGRATSECDLFIYIE